VGVEDGVVFVLLANAALCELVVLRLKVDLVESEIDVVYVARCLAAIGLQEIGIAAQLLLAVQLARLGYLRHRFALQGLLGVLLGLQDFSDFDSLVELVVGFETDRVCALEALLLLKPILAN
jgi:hypothetical protein